VPAQGFDFINSSPLGNNRASGPARPTAIIMVKQAKEAKQGSDSYKATPLAFVSPVGRFVAKQSSILLCYVFSLLATQLGVVTLQNAAFVISRFGLDVYVSVPALQYSPSKCCCCCCSLNEFINFRWHGRNTILWDFSLPWRL